MRRKKSFSSSCREFKYRTLAELPSEFNVFAVVFVTELSTLDSQIKRPFPCLRHNGHMVLGPIILYNEHMVLGPIVLYNGHMVPGPIILSFNLIAILA